MPSRAVRIVVSTDTARRVISRPHDSIGPRSAVKPSAATPVCAGSTTGSASSFTSSSTSASVPAASPRSSMTCASVMIGTPSSRTCRTVAANARNLLPRRTSVTLRAIGCSDSAQSNAESPPPTITTSWSRSASSSGTKLTTPRPSQPSPPGPGGGGGSPPPPARTVVPAPPRPRHELPPAAAPPAAPRGQRARGELAHARGDQDGARAHDGPAVQPDLELAVHFGQRARAFAQQVCGLELVGLLHQGRDQISAQYHGKSRHVEDLLLRVHRRDLPARFRQRVHDSGGQLAETGVIRGEQTGRACADDQQVDLGRCLGGAHAHTYLFERGQQHHKLPGHDRP